MNLNPVSSESTPFVPSHLTSQSELKRKGAYGRVGRPEHGHLKMTIGLSKFRDEKKLTLPKLLVLPFKGDTGADPINRN